MRNILATSVFVGLAVQGWAQSFKPVEFVDLSSGQTCHAIVATLELPELSFTKAAQQIDWTTTTTPPPLSVYELTYTSTGHAYALSGWPMYEVTYALPFHMDVKAGHGFIIATDLTEQAPANAQPLWGYGAYVSRNVGGQGFFIKLGAALIFDPNTDGKKWLGVLDGSFGFKF